VTHFFDEPGHRCAGRSHGRSPFGRSGGFPAGGSGSGGGRLGRGRKFAAADLQLLILALLAERPRHGYEIIKALDERSNGYYSPSPGMVYPALTYLEEIGRATVEAEGTRKLYRITADGRSHLEANRATVDAILAQLDWIGRRMDRFREVFSADEGAGGEAAVDLDSPAAPGGRRHRVLYELHAARLKLKAALVRSFGSSAEEQRRVARILERAADEILGRSRGGSA
jgi:DNA-binding PadR family transcriptional regulator